MGWEIRFILLIYLSCQESLVVCLQENIKTTKLILHKRLQADNDHPNH